MDAVDYDAAKLKYCVYIHWRFTEASAATFTFAPKQNPGIPPRENLPATLREGPRRSRIAFLRGTRARVRG